MDILLPGTLYYLLIVSTLIWDAEENLLLVYLTVLGDRRYGVLFRGWKNYTTAFGIPVFAVLYYTKTRFLKDPGYRYPVTGRLSKYHTAPSRLSK